MRFVNAAFYILVGLCLLFAISFDIHFGLLFAAPLFLIRGIIEIFAKK